MKAKYFFQLIALSALWGATFMMTRISAPALGPNLSAALRMVMATVTLTVLMRSLKQSWPLSHWRELFVLGFLAVAGPHVMYSRASLVLPAGYGSLLSVTSVLFGAFASGFLKQERLTPAKWMGCIVGFAGAGLVVRLGPVEPSPELVSAALVCMGGAALSGIATPYLKRAMARMEPLAVTAGMHAAAVLLMLPGALYDLPRAQFTLPALLSVTVMGVATSGLAYWLYMRIVRHVPPMAALSSTFMSTGFGVLWAVLLLAEPTGGAMMAGGAMILLACLLVFGLNPLQWRLLSPTDKS